jgi:hypothetical protein
MNLHSYMKRSLRRLLSVMMIIVTAPLICLAAADMEELVPSVHCGNGWKADGKTLFYDRETLSDRINGEAELYFPYGFDRMAAAHYVSENSPGAGMDVEIFRMGSLLDAFGMYANYRHKDGRTISAGTESNLSGSQLFLYQGRYFVHIQTTGSNSDSLEALSTCGQAVTRRLPDSRSRPTELAPLDRLKILIKGSERYLPQSLLGYDFLNRGIIADAMIDRQHLQIFLLLNGTERSASDSLERYRSQLSQVKTGTGTSGSQIIEGTDTLYGPVLLLKNGACMAGAIKFSSKDGIIALLENICRR